MGGFGFFLGTYQFLTVCCCWLVVCTQVDYCVCDLFRWVLFFCSHNKKGKDSSYINGIYYILPIVVPFALIFLLLVMVF